MKYFIKRFLLGTLALVQGFPSMAWAGRECDRTERILRYQVRKNDQLGYILWSLGLRPLWGTNNYVQRTAKLNQIPEAGLLLPGQIIQIPLLCEGPTVIVPENPPAPLVTKDNSASERTPKPLEDSAHEGSVLQVDFIGQYIALNGTQTDNNTKGTLLSEFSPGLRLQWEQVWSDRDRTRLFLQVLKTNLYPESRGVTIHNKEQTLSHFGFGYFTTVSPRWDVGAAVELGPALFYRGSQIDDGLEVNAVPLLRLHPELRYLLKESRRLRLHFLAGASYYTSSSYGNYTVEPGFGYEVGLAVTHTLASGSDMHCKTFYDYRSQNTSLLTYSEQGAYLQCGWSWWLP